MPSTTSSSVSAVLASSTVMTPSLPTFCIASAMYWPISFSPLAEIVPTWATSSEVLIFLALATRSLTTGCRQQGRCRASGPSGSCRLQRPCRLRERWPGRERSPSSCRHRRCRWSSKQLRGPSGRPCFRTCLRVSISLATETPSLVMRGAPIGLVDDDVTALRTERDLHCVCEDVDAAQHLFARGHGRT